MVIRPRLNVKDISSMIKAYTSLEQSQMLVEKGLDTKTADMFWQHVMNEHNGKDFWKAETKQLWWKPFTTDNYIPCWSAVRIMALLPDEIAIDKDSIKMKMYHLSIEKYEPWRYYIAYYRTNFITDEIDVLHEVDSLDSPLDALYEMLIWVLDNGYQDIDIHKEIAETEND